MTSYLERSVARLKVFNIPSFIFSAEVRRMIQEQDLEGPELM